MCWSVPLQTLSAQADKAVFTLKRVIKSVGGLPISLSLDLFDKLVLPILLYGAEIWGTQYRESIELVHRKFCKYTLSVSYNTSNAPVLGDLGRTPLSVLYKYRSVKFWLSIVHDNNTRLRNSLYRLLKQSGEVRGNTWGLPSKAWVCYSLRACFALHARYSPCSSINLETKNQLRVIAVLHWKYVGGFWLHIDLSL